MNGQLWFTGAVGFEAARQVSLLSPGHRSSRIHGHSFLARVRAELPKGWASFPGDEVGALRSELARCVEPLDYQDLNKHIEQPTDENLARWIRSRSTIPGVTSVGIQSTRDEGVDMDERNHVHIWRRYSFESAHKLPHVPPGHKCGRLHGHSFEIIIHADQDLGARALGVDFDHLDRLWAPVHEELDHTCLNDVSGLENPTSELISSWVWNRLKPHLPELSWVTVYETAGCGANFDGARYRIWKEMTMDSAIRLAHAPAGDKRRRIHGHTYTLRLHLDAPLDTVMGWTVDFGDVKEIFNPVFKKLDHHPLYELPNIADNDTASLAYWIQGQSASQLPQLDRIDLYETRGCGVILSWGEAAPALPI